LIFGIRYMTKTDFSDVSVQSKEEKSITGNFKIDWLEVSRLLLLSRELDLLEETQLAPQGKIKYQFSAKGHELAQILLALALDYPHDAATVYYRSRPFMLATGLTPDEALAGGMARSGSPTKGRDTGVVYNWPRRSGLTVLPASGNVGAQYTPAAGWAQAILYRQYVLGEADWEGSIAVALGGDGSVASNGFWAGLNIATTLRLPLLFFIEDNSYGLSVPSDLQTPGGNIAANLASFKNILLLDGDGTDPPEAFECITQAVNHVRSGEGACLLRLQLPRLSGHTFIDDQAYKSPEQLESEAQRDPLDRMRQYLSSLDVHPETWQALQEEVKSQLADALNMVESSQEPDANEVTRHLFFEGVPQLQGGLRPEKALLPVGPSHPNPAGPRINFVDAVRKTLIHEMELNQHIAVFGEDVGVIGGVHGATLDMQTKFGERRVFDTSLSEEGIIGRSVGMALAGLLPLPEIQFRKYADPAHEQLTDLGTLRWRSANNFAAPVVVRIPVGYGKKSGDPWHSVSGEAIYAHTLGWRIAYPSNASDAVGLLRTAMRSDDPTFFLEHRALLDTAEGRRPYPGDDYCLPFGEANILTQGDELLIITWGEMVHRCLSAASTFQGRVTLMDLRTIIPWDKERVLESVRHTGKVLIVHEDTLTGGFAGEIISVIAAEAFNDLDAPIMRLATPDIPIPYNVNMMESVIPSVKTVHTKIEELLAF
jgi:2-oxoisovalerate dehydrogenase E1 component